jgi:hypothetical protein
VMERVRKQLTDSETFREVVIEDKKAMSGM